MTFPTPLLSCPSGGGPRPKYSRFSAAGKNPFPLDVHVLPVDPRVAGARKPASWSGLFRFSGPTGGGEPGAVFWYSGLLAPWKRSSYLGFRTPDAGLPGPFMLSFI